MTISTLHIAAAANRFSQTADVSPHSVVAFGSSKLVVLWHIEKEADTNAQETLPGHEGLITCVRFASEQLLVSADDKGTVILWRKSDGQWRIASKTGAHSQSISSLCVYDDALVTGSSDATVKIWRIENDSMVHVQTLPQGSKYPLALAVARLPSSKAIILAVSGTDKNVNVWLRSSGGCFVHAASLGGHEDWVRGLAFRPSLDEGQPLVLASASQDATIRLWRIENVVSERSQSQTVPTELSDELLDTFEASLADIGDAEEGGRQISLKQHILSVKLDSGSYQRFSVTLDALLIGHEASVTCLSWRPAKNPEFAPTLLSASTDSSVIMWSPSAAVTHEEDETNAIWINRQRFGDVGGQRLGGFVGATWAQGGEEALAWGWAGGWRRWRCNGPTSNESEEVWDEVSAISGHNGPVRGLAWSPGGDYLISAGLDQTSRIHAPILDPSRNNTYWHEVARPQVHGYDLLDAAFINSLKFVSIADEKVARVFEAPRSFVDSVENLRVATFSDKEHIRPLAANVPPLGLSNKAIGDSVSESSILNSSRRPFESELAAITLWPEVEKLFGHGYESITLGVSSSRHLIATACKATSSEHAVIRLYDAQTFRHVGQPLPGHNLTVTRIAFSPDDRYLLSVSRDRSWRLFESQDDGGYVAVAADKSHGRIIWDCAWSREGDCFATASRDKTVKIWQYVQGDKWEAIATIKTDSGATAVDFAARDAHGRRKLAIGLETGEISIYTNDEEIADWRLTVTKPLHIDQIHRVAWRLNHNKNSTELASCSEDGTLKILDVLVDMV
ncbi:WD40-repeat-containing domain protein [Amanita rubescens]|nr:WD40-repeat-containing domain protein [Amanita rubescens]